jgi:hypothetical protein
MPYDFHIICNGVASVADDYQPDENGLFPDGKFYPVTQTIGEHLSAIPTDDSKMLVIRLELPYYEYAGMEDLIAVAIKAKEDRVTRLTEMTLRDFKNGDQSLSELFTENDLRITIQNARADLQRAIDFLHKIKRPPPR